MSDIGVADAAAPPAPAVRVRLVTDLTVTQIPWWARLLDVRPRTPRGGAVARLRAVADLIRAARRSDVFISSNVRNALALGLYKRLTFARRPHLMMTEMRLDDPLPGLRWRAKVALQRFAFTAVDAMCVSARREAETYAERLRLPLHRFRFVPWHTNVLDPHLCPARGDYVFAAGRTGRDWATLAAAAELAAAVPFTVVCTRGDAGRVRFPNNVTVLTDVPYARYRELLEGARVVVVPLEPHAYSSGQVVILEAMAFGKPVIVTHVLGSEDYVEHGVDGLLVAPGDGSALAAAITRIHTTDGLSQRLSEAALARVIRLHTLDRYVRNLVQIADELSADRASAFAVPRAS
jgi:glycosyltransferase involved in cell wall biosynthesis